MRLSSKHEVKADKKQKQVLEQQLNDAMKQLANQAKEQENPSQKSMIRFLAALQKAMAAQSRFLYPLEQRYTFPHS